MSNILPSAFIRSLIENYNIDKEEFIKSHENGRKLTSVRMNPSKPSGRFAHETPVPWSTEGRYLSERPSFTADPLFHAGCYYVQEASSMFLEQILRHSTDLSQDLKVLDLCASPGGKSTLITSLITESSLLVSNEIIKTRVSTLVDNLTKWGPANSFVSNNDPRDFKKAGAFFDVIMVDAPCSGSGMFRKDPDAISEWSESAVQLCSERQQRILADIYPALKQQGLLVYSTCSYSKQENEFVADWLCDTFDLSSIQIPIQKEWGIDETRSDKHQCYGYRFYPHKVKGEGLFITCFRKNEETTEPKLKRVREQIKGKNEDIINKWLRSPDEYYIMNLLDEYFAVKKDHAAYLQYLQSNLYLKKSGVRLGKIMGNNLVPNHELALSLILTNDIPRIELSREESISYLKRDALKHSTGSKGWVLICYQGYALGWAKVLDNRVNNYFPKELRITNQGIS